MTAEMRDYRSVEPKARKMDFQSVKLRGMIVAI